MAESSSSHPVPETNQSINLQFWVVYDAITNLDITKEDLVKVFCNKFQAEILKASSVLIRNGMPYSRMAASQTALQARSRQWRSVGRNVEQAHGVCGKSIACARHSGIILLATNAQKYNLATATHKYSLQSIVMREQFLAGVGGFLLRLRRITVYEQHEW
jgi:hypothetical protein